MKSKTLRTIRMPNGTSKFSPGMIIVAAVIVIAGAPVTLPVIGIGAIVMLIIDGALKVRQVKVQNPPTQTQYTTRRR